MKRLPNRCPNCDIQSTHNVPMLQFIGPEMILCKFCKYYSRLKPGSKNTWYCSQAMEIIAMMMKEDGYEKK